MTGEKVYVGVDVAKSTLDVAVTDSEEARQFANDDKGITQAVSYIAGLKSAVIILEATGNLEMSLTAALQADRLPVAVINPCQVRDFARATGALAKTDTIDARIIALFGTGVLLNMAVKDGLMTQNEILSRLRYAGQTRRDVLMDNAH